MNIFEPHIVKNDKRAWIFILTVSVVVFLAVIILGNVQVPVNDAFDVHIFAKFNAVVNSMVSVLLILAMVAIKKRNYRLHRNLMLFAMVLSILFLLSYICHHLFSPETKYGGIGMIRYVYFFILITHITLATIILPFILFTAYRGLISEWPAHRKLARYTWPVWLYVSITGVIVYLLISPYYTAH
jgi:putative membrane protein